MRISYNRWHLMICHIGTDCCLKTFYWKLLKDRKVLTSKLAVWVSMTGKKNTRNDIVALILRKAKILMFLMTQKMVVWKRKIVAILNLKVIQKNWTLSAKLFEKYNKCILFIFSFHVNVQLKISICNCVQYSFY